MSDGVKRRWKRFFVKKYDKFLVRKDYVDFSSNKSVFDRIFTGLKQGTSLSTLLSYFDQKTLVDWCQESSNSFENGTVPVIYDIAEAVGFEKNLRFSFVTVLQSKTEKKSNDQILDLLKRR